MGRASALGGGPAGSLFAYFLLTFADLMDLSLDVDIYEPRDFTKPGPAGCNMCGGIVSESLIQALAVEGISLPASVVQRGIDSYQLHTSTRSVRIDTPLNEMRIAAIHRGGGRETSMRSSGVGWMGSCRIWRATWGRVDPSARRRVELGRRQADGAPEGRDEDP
jgi:hypothetical protein